MDATVWLYWLGGQALGGAGVAVVLWALLGDRLLKGHTKRRCPKCWHDLSATPGLTCPECGRTARSEARLFRSRKRRRLAAVGVVGVVLGTGVNSWPWMRGSGWARFAPLPILAASWPECSNPAKWELLEFVQKNPDPGWLARRTIAWSSERALRTGSQADQAIALDLLTAAKVRSPRAEQRARQALLGPAAAGWTGGGLTGAACGYLNIKLTPSEFVDLAEQIAEGDPSQSKATLIGWILGKVVERDPSLSADALRVVLRPGREQAVPQFSFPEDLALFNQIFRALLVVSSEPGLDAATVELLLGTRNWKRALEDAGSLEPFRVMAERTAATPADGRFVWTQLLSEVVLPGVIDVVIDAAGDANDASRLELVWVVHTRLWYNRDGSPSGRGRLSDRALDQCIRWFTGDDRRLGVEVRNLLDAAENGVGPWTLAVLDDPRPELRKDAVYLLGRRRPMPPEVYAKIEAVLNDSSQPAAVRVAAWTALDGLPRPEGLPTEREEPRVP